MIQILHLKRMWTMSEWVSNTCSLLSSCLFAGRSCRRALLSWTLTSVLLSHSCRGSALASNSVIWDCRFCKFDSRVIFHSTKTTKMNIIYEAFSTLSASCLIWRLLIRLFQSSLALATFASIPSTLSLDTTAISSSPQAPTVLSRAWPFSLSLKNSWGGTPRQRGCHYLAQKRSGGERREKYSLQPSSIFHFLTFHGENYWA